MKIATSFSKSILLLIVSAFLFGSAPLSLYAQKRGKAPQKSPSRAAGLVDEADKMAEEKKWPEAIDVYKIAIRLDANYAPAYGGLGDAYFNSGNSEQALAAYKEQVRLAPNDATAQFDLGYFYNAMGRHGEAFAPLVKATSLDPNFAEAYYGIGYAYLRGADFEKSISFLKSAVRLKPDYGEAYFGLGQAYARLGKADLAHEQLKKLNTVDPKLARKLEKEMQTALATASVTTSGQTPTSSTTANQTQPPSTEKPSIKEAAKTQSAAPQTSTQSSPSTTEPVSRQLQQLPPPAQAPASTTSPASPSVTPVDQIAALPVGAKRWALVIGVDKYTDPQISPLKGSDNDARLIANALVRYAGFPQDQVILLSTDQPTERQPTRVNILRRLSNLSTAVPKDGLLLVSFAGHGMERSGQAFLLPSDAQISDQISFLEETAISMNRVKERIKETGVAQVVMLLDACRNDPGGRADAPNNLSNAYTSAFNFDVHNREVQAFATVYATGIGQRAYEYTEKKQGYFSWAVVEGLKGGAANEKGEITLSQLVRYVQDTVPKRLAIDLGSTKQQKPFAVIEGYRADELVVAVTNSASNTATSTTPNVAMVDPAAIELSFWESIKSSNNPEDFKAYLDKYPDGQFAALAKTRAQVRSSGNMGSGDSLDMTYWNAIKDSKNPGDFKAYQAKFPNGFFADLAASRLAALGDEEKKREKVRILAESLNVEETSWLGSVFAGKPEEKHGVKLEFLKGGIFNGTYQVMTTVPGFLVDSYSLDTIKLSGTWRQTDDLVSIQLAQPSGEGIKLTVSEVKMQGASDQGNFKFTVEKILRKPLSANGQNVGPCDFHGFKVGIRYRKKDKIDRTEDATKLAERLRSFGLEVDVEKSNLKDYGTALHFYNGQGDIAAK
ncbi:MAG: caspase family protein, partial [Acidobacteriota bacterium]|nr:caspase family protein [Acidobacteriota bacterium]